MRRPASGASKASDTSPRIDSTTGSCSRPRSGRTRCSGTRHRSPTPAAFSIDKSGARAQTEQIVDDYDVRTPGVDVAAYALSGGNQQKLVVGREMLAQPRLLIASHPTRGIDVGAQAAVWDSIRQARSAGLAVLLLSADLEELIGLSDTLLVILRGHIVATLDPATVTPVDLGLVHDGREGGHGGVTRTRRIMYGLAAPVAAVLFAILVSAVVLVASGYSAHRRVQGDVAVHGLDRFGGRDHQPGDPVLRFGARRRHRLQDGAVQHRRRWAVPPGRSAVGRRRCRRDVPGASASRASSSRSRSSSARCGPRSRHC